MSNTKSDTKSDTATLFNAYLDDELTDDQGAELVALLEDSAEHREQFAQHTFRYRVLHDLFAANESGEETVAVGIAKQPAVEHATVAPGRAKSMLNWASRHPHLPSLAISMLMIASVLAGLAMTPVTKRVAEGSSTQDNTPDQPDETTGHVARLSNSQNAVWADGPPLNDPRLNIGTHFVLTSGLVEIQYNTGAHLVVEGPAEFEVLGKKNIRLTHGKLVGRCEEEQSKGFIVETPTARIEDLGTEFGVNVAISGATHVIVFEGDIRLQSAQNAAETFVIDLAADESATVSHSGVLESDPSFEDDFVRRLLPAIGEIVGIKGNIDMLPEPPQSVHIGQQPFPRAIMFFTERRDALLKHDTLVSTWDPTTHRIETSSGATETLRAGTRVDSHYFTIRPSKRKPKRSSKEKWARQRKKKVTRFTGSVTFARPVLGVIAGAERLTQTNTALGYPPTKYPSNGSHVESQDRIWLSEDRHTINFSMKAYDPQGDQLRVLVDASESPQTQKITQSETE